MTTDALQRSATARTSLAIALLAGAGVAVGLGVYGTVHDPTGRSLVTLVFTATINLKVWLATIVIALASFQLWGALRMYGKIGSADVPDWVGPVHRLAGTAAFLISIPVAYHCLWALGFQTGNGTRILVHSLAGCLFYGTLVTKIFFVRSKRVMYNWGLPFAGGALFTTIVVVWLSSSLWFFTNVEFPGF